MVPYVVKSVICLGLLLLAYHIFLEKERMHRFNRWYLLLAILASFTVPLLRFTISSDATPVLQNRLFDVLSENDWINPVGQSQFVTGTSQVETFGAPSQVPVPVGLIIYLGVVLVLSARFVRNIYRLLLATYQNKTIRQGNATLVLVKNSVASYSFLHYIFISEEEFASSAIEEELITHELTHVRQKHSYDVIFIELLQIVFWFNPLLPLYKKAIQLNHEYLADEAVVRAYEDVPAYQFLLLAKASRNSYACLTSNFNYSVTKKRLRMLTLNNNPVRAAFKQMSVLPVLAVVVFFLSSRNITIAQDKKTDAVTQEPASPTKIPSVLFPDMSRIPEGPGISDAEVKEYNNIAASAVAKPVPGQRNAPKFTGTSADRARLLDLFKKMNKTQRYQATINFAKKIPPPSKKVPGADSFEKWKNPEDYGIWIDGKKVGNDALNNYSPTDFSHYSASNLAYTEKNKQDIMKRYNLKTMYKVQLDLYTNAEFAKMTERANAAPEYTMMYHRNWDNGKKRQVDWKWMIDESK